MSIKVTRTDEENSLIISLAGQLTLGEGVWDLKEAVQKISHDELKGKYLVLDLGEKTKFDSSGIGEISSLHMATAQRGSALFICGLTRHQLGVFRVTQMDRVLHILPDRAQAVATLKADPLKLQPVPVG